MSRSHGLDKVRVVSRRRRRRRWRGEDGTKKCSLSLSLCVHLGSVGTVAAECRHYSSRATFPPPPSDAHSVHLRRGTSAFRLPAELRKKTNKAKQNKTTKTCLAPSASSSLRRGPRLTRRHCRRHVTTEPSEGIPVGTRRARRARSGREREREGDTARGRSRATR